MSTTTIPTFNFIVMPQRQRLQTQRVHKGKPSKWHCKLLRLCAHLRWRVRNPTTCRDHRRAQPMMMRSGGFSNLFVPYVSHCCLLLKWFFFFYLLECIQGKKKEKKKLMVVSFVSKLDRWLKFKGGI